MDYSDTKRKIKDNAHAPWFAFNCSLSIIWRFPDIIQEHDYTDIEQEVNTSPAAPDDAIEPNNEPSDCINNSTDEIAKPTFVQIRPKPLQKLTSILSDSKETGK